MEREVWIIVEHHEGEIEEAALELFIEGRRLADRLKVRLSALLLGREVAKLADTLGPYGADNVYLIEDPLLEDYTTDAYTTVIAGLARKHDPAVILTAGTAFGRDLAPRLATRLKAGLLTDAVILKVNDRNVLEMTRPTDGGRVYATYTCPSAGLQVVSMRPGILGLPTPKRGRPVPVEKVEVDLKPSSVRTKVLGHYRVSPETLDITEAESVVAFGRGLTGKSTMDKMSELASLLGASLAGSRMAVDAGWIPFERQIGQTGRIISPKFILCSGISGASHFTLGMKDAKFIVAVNRDKQAPIFKTADISVLADINEFTPALVDHVRAKKLPETEKLKVKD